MRALLFTSLLVLLMPWQVAVAERQQCFYLPTEVLERVAQIPDEWLRESTFAPVVENGEWVGWRLMQSAPQSLVQQFGLQVGDTVLAVNQGYADQPNAFFAEFAKVKNSQDVHLTVLTASDAVLTLRYILDPYQYCP